MTERSGSAMARPQGGLALHAAFLFAGEAGA